MLKFGYLEIGYLGPPTGRQVIRISTKIKNSFATKQ